MPVAASAINGNDHREAALGNFSGFSVSGSRIAQPGAPRTALLGEKRLTRATMQMRPLAAQANVEEKRIAELKARLKENLSLLDRERTCRELTRMQGELIKTSLCPT